MDFFDPKKKRAHKIRLYIGYVLMGIALAIGTLILLFQANGYDLDPRTGTVVQNGLVFVDAHPESALVTIDNQAKGQTDTRLVIPSGTHDLLLKREGYRDWKRNFDLDGGSVRRFAYPFLFPKNLVMKDVEIYGNPPGLATQSPDRRWLLVQQPGTLFSFETIDLNPKTNTPATINLPQELFTTSGANHNLELVEWSTDNRHVLVKHNFEGGHEFVLIDRESPASSININKLFPVPITTMTLRDKQFDQYYFHDANGGVIRTADLKTRQLTPILSHVLNFRPYGANVILYVSDENAQPGKVNVKIRDNATIFGLRQLPISKKYLIDITQFDGSWYMVVGDDTEHKTYIYKDVFTDLRQVPVKPPLPISVLRVANPEYVSFSTNARFIAVQGGSEFAVYDAENNERFRYDTKLTLLPGQKASWMDGHRLAIVSQDKANVFDFDGTNLQTLSDANPTHPIFYNRDYDAMFTITNSRQVQLKPALVRTELRVLPTGQ